MCWSCGVTHVRADEIGVTALRWVQGWLIQYTSSVQVQTGDEIESFTESWIFQQHHVQLWRWTGTEGVSPLWCVTHHGVCLTANLTVTEWVSFLPQDGFDRASWRTTGLGHYSVECAAQRKLKPPWGLFFLAPPYRLQLNHALLSFTSLRRYKDKGSRWLKNFSVEKIWFMYYDWSDNCLHGCFVYLHSGSADTVTWVTFANHYILIKAVA